MLKSTSTGGAFPLLLLSIDWPTTYQTLAAHPLVCLPSQPPIPYRCPAKVVHIGSPCSLRIKTRFIIVFASASKQHPLLVAASLSLQPELSLFSLPLSLSRPTSSPPFFPFSLTSPSSVSCYLCLLEASVKGYSTCPLFPETAVRNRRTLNHPEEKKKTKTKTKKDNMGVAGTRRNVRTRRPIPRTTTGGRPTLFNLAARLVFIFYLKFQSFSLMRKPLVMCGANSLPALIEF